MPKINFIPASDQNFLAWSDNFLDNLAPENGVEETDLATLKLAVADYHVKTAHLNKASSQAKQATSDKNDSRQHLESLFRAEARRIKARSNYNVGMGANLGIEGAENSFDLTTASPDLDGIDLSGGSVTLSFSKYKSNGINLYCKRENDADWVKLARILMSPFSDNRPLLQVGKPEIRRYTAVYMSNDDEVGKYSNEVVISCAP
jgi:hypothetical protein